MVKLHSDLGECTRAMLDKWADKAPIPATCEHCDHAFETCAKDIHLFESSYYCTCPECGMKVFGIDRSKMSIAQMNAAEDKPTWY